MEREQQRKELQEAMRGAKDRRHYERYQAVLLYLNGYTRIEIGRIIGRRHETVGSYISSYKKEGLSGLQLGHSPGKPKRLSEEQEAALRDIITTNTPADVGFEARYNWTLALVTAYVRKEWDISYSLRGMSILLKRIGLSYTRPTYTLEKADPVKQREFMENTFPSLKKS